MLPPGEPPYVTSLEEVAWGLVLTAVTILIHGVATTWSIVATSPRSASGPTRPIRDLGRIIALAELIVLIHLVEVLVWAAFFYWGGNFEIRVSPTTSPCWNTRLSGAVIICILDGGFWRASSRSVAFSHSLGPLVY